MQFCTYCGRYLSEYDDICPECGTVIHPERLVEEPYRHGLLLLIVFLMISAVVAFAASYYLNSFILFLFIPFFFFSRNRSEPLSYILTGTSIGVGMGLMAMWIYRYSGLF